MCSTAVRPKPVDKDSENAPDYRIFAGATEFGAAWKKTSRENRKAVALAVAVAP